MDRLQVNLGKGGFLVGSYSKYTDPSINLGGLFVASYLAAGLCTVFIPIILILPTILLTSTLIESIEFLMLGFSNNTLQVPPPPENINSLPFIGSPLAKFWGLASENLEAALNQIAPHITIIGGWLLLTAKGTGLGILQFIVAIIISGFLLAKSKNGQQLTLLIVTRFAGERRRGEKIMDLTYATVHSVALDTRSCHHSINSCRIRFLLSPVCRLLDYGHCFA